MVCLIFISIPSKFVSIKDECNNLILLNIKISLKSDLHIYAAETTELNTFKIEERQYLPYCYSKRGLKSFLVNLTFKLMGHLILSQQKYKFLISNHCNINAFKKY